VLSDAISVLTPHRRTVLHLLVASDCDTTTPTSDPRTTARSQRALVRAEAAFDSTQHRLISSFTVPVAPHANDRHTPAFGKCARG
jgi:hypothetical protein